MRKKVGAGESTVMRFSPYTETEGAMLFVHNKHVLLAVSDKDTGASVGAPVACQLREDM